MENKLTLRFLSYSEFARIEKTKRVKSILDIVLTGKIVILQGKLETAEETGLIQATMALVGRIKGFKGVEIAVINPDSEQAFMDKIKVGIAKVVAGDRYSLTIIGPASLVKEIKRDPKKIELLLKR